MTRIRIMLLTLVLLLTACGGSQENTSTDATEEVIDPQQLLEDVIESLQEVDTFRLIITQGGKEYPLTITLDGGESFINAVLRRLEGQYVAPELVFARVSVRLGGLPLELEIFANGADQWIRPAGLWLNIPFDRDFDPSSILAENQGLQAALGTLENIVFIGETTLDVGTPVYHLQGDGTGETVNQVLFNFLNSEEPVLVDVFVDRETLYPALLLVTQTESAEDDEDPTRWDLEIFAVNEEPEYEDPTADNASSSDETNTETDNGE